MDDSNKAARRTNNVPSVVPNQMTTYGAVHILGHPVFACFQYLPSPDQVFSAVYDQDYTLVQFESYFICLDFSRRKCEVIRRGVAIF